LHRSREVNLPPGIVKNRKPLTLPLSRKLVAMLKKKFQTNGPVFNMKNFRREWFKACVKIGVGEKTGVVSAQGSYPSRFPLLRRSEPD